MSQDPPPKGLAQPIPPWAFALTRLLDDGISIPGTRIGVGLDAILGFFLPTLGDAATGLVSLALLVLGFQMRVPRVVLLRMVFNIALDTVLGSVPFLGDVFDLFWRSNRRNLTLLQRYDHELERKPKLADYLVVVLGVLLVLAAVAAARAWRRARALAVARRERSLKTKPKSAPRARRLARPQARQLLLV